MKRWLVFSGCLALPLFASTGRAADAETAEALFISGREAMARGDLALACPRLAESQRLDPAVGTLLNLADCEERSGKLASALAHFQEAHDELPPADYRVPFSTDRIQKLTPRVPRLVLKVSGAAGASAAGMTLVRDGTTLGPASLDVPLPVDPGAHVATLHLPGHSDTKADVSLREGETKTLELAPGALVSVPPRSPARHDAQKKWGLGIGAAGLGGLLVGGVFGVTSKLTYDRAESECPKGPNQCSSAGASGSSSAYAQAAASDVAFIAGGALLVAGVALYFTAPKEGRVAIAPVVGTRKVGLDLALSF
jgi:hypothetical protein